METNIIIRPHGKMYIIGTVLVYEFLLGLLSFSVLFIMSQWYWALLIEIAPIICLVLETKEIVNYKLRLTDKQIHLSAQREWFITRHKKLDIRYKGIKSIQYFIGVLQARFVSAISLVYCDGQLKYLDVARFSEKQVKAIIKHIQELAERENMYSIEIKPDEIQKGFNKVRK